MKITFEHALKLLCEGEIVALPTETVYGLAGRIDREDTIIKIFETKKRPLFDPLIIHVPNIASAQKYTLDWNIISEKLARTFWPGPLTLLLKKSNLISPLITADSNFVGIRSPQHPLFLQILNELNIPLAAPSANFFKKTSPTNADHVIEEFSGKISVLDGGQCIAGIESTIINTSNPNHLLIHRPGPIGLKEIQKIVGNDIKISFTTSEHAPGQLNEHYRPKIPLHIYISSNVNHFLNQEFANKNVNTHFINLNSNPILAARELYAELRKENSVWIKKLICFSKEQWNSENWTAIRNRIEKAASEIKKI